MISYGQALYAPSIDIDDKWLKTAALYYDKINRIVPRNVDPKNSDTLKLLNEELNLVREIEPSNHISIDVEFLKYAHENLATIEQRMALAKAIGNINHPTVIIHSDKMTSQLLQEIVNMGLARHGKENWYEFDALTGLMYMGFLSKKISEERAIPLVTSSEVFHGVIKSLDYLKAEDTAFMLGSLVIESYTIKDVENVDVKKIVEFRKKYNDEQKEFYALINELCSDINLVTSQEALKEILEFKKSKINNAVLKIERAGSGIGLNIIRGTFSTIWKFTLGDNIEAISSGVDTIGAAINLTKNKDALSYILALRDELDKEKLAKQLVLRKIVI